eukprot:Anaeramoba_flamelloidesc41287_g1_i3.p1 GENE.c41287_g1_i3~~c41287_g1_i3.p1  ORF type:complete len:177 (-),score=49.64 c41287_g1_i3:75-605(-)
MTKDLTNISQKIRGVLALKKGDFVRHLGPTARVQWLIGKDLENNKGLFHKNYSRAATKIEITHKFKQKKPSPKKLEEKVMIENQVNSEGHEHENKNEQEKRLEQVNKKEYGHENKNENEYKELKLEQEKATPKIYIVIKNYKPKKGEDHCLILKKGEKIEYRKETTSEGWMEGKKQ